MTKTAPTPGAVAPHDIAALTRRISASQIRLAERHPFFAALLLMAPVEITERVPTAATDGRHLFFNPAFMAELPSAQLDGLVVHELLHCALLHLPRRGEREPLLWNVAADIHINGMIRDLPGLDLPPGGVEEPRLARLCVEEIYVKLAKSKSVSKLKLVDLLDTPAGGGGAGRGGSSNGGSASEDAAAEELGTFWADAIHRAMAAATSQGVDPGSLPAALVRAVQETHTPQLDWRSALWRHLVRTPDDFSGFDRRHVWQGLYVETLEGESVDVDVCIDTSGSVDDRQLSMFLAELRGIVRAYPSVRCRLYYADAQCHGPFEVDANRPFDVAQGGGGTDFRPFFQTTDRRDDRAARLGSEQPALAVYLTDGHGTFPAEAPDRPVLWVVTAGGLASAEFRFGEVVRMKQ
jgi:predicted metal-dependent peptidase